MSPPGPDAGPYRDGTRTPSTEPRADRGREWEVFVRESMDEPLRHVGSVTADDAATAEARAASLFEWSAVAIWVCPTDEVRRFDARDLADRDGRASGGERAGAKEHAEDERTGAEERTSDADDAAREGRP